ncbi:hypothetical protein BJF93_16155 [Xaviernesmea oryzae]|uniref:3-deoxy-manno-octulosonate cytidylyltransferase n=1 Tax=Xaviernesmea oryzae TaxID=464029 RepID=A0A1Q9ASX1_9HYPH|nr:hypothetical protein [Xaviernesmea oryzae]OLP58415.1 hypothetical protein BJF93_16155 [Xaviernesmea oryzae]SEM33936.1 hypothetical protein SAMN04487976_13017 [Xaviernesmea oryzae]
MTMPLPEMLRAYDAVALIANSESVVIDEIVAALPARTLYVFFTGCAKVLNGPFPHDAILCHRLVAGGTRFLKSQKHFDRAHSFFPQGLKAEVGLLAERGAASDAVTRQAPRASALVAETIDFDHVFAGFYPEGRMPTTGFALALWLIEAMPQARIYLCGFTGVAGAQFNMYVEHDWTFEQTLLSLFEQSGRLSRLGQGAGLSTDSFARIHSRFPEFGEGKIALAAAQSLANRFTGMERQMAKLWAMTKMRRNIRAFFKRIFK